MKLSEADKIIKKQEARTRRWNSPFYWFFRSILRLKVPPEKHYWVFKTHAALFDRYGYLDKRNGDWTDWVTKSSFNGYKLTRVYGPYLTPEEAFDAAALRQKDEDDSTLRSLYKG